MLRIEHVLKDAGKVDCRTFAGTAKSGLDGRALETTPIMEYVWERTSRALAKEDLLRAPQSGGAWQEANDGNENSTTLKCW